MGTGTSVLVPVPGKILGHGTVMLDGMWRNGGGIKRVNLGCGLRRVSTYIGTGMYEVLKPNRYV